MGNVNCNKIDSDTLVKYTFTGVGATLAAAKGVSIFNKTDQSKVEKIKNAVNGFLDSTKLREKGLMIENLTDIKKTEFAHLPRILNPDAKIVRGSNAAFRPLCNSVAVNMEKMPLTAFHELGHAHNFYNGFKFMLFARPACTVAAIAAAFLPAIIDKPNKNKEDYSFGDKVKDKLCNNAPLITAACYLPVVFEEGLASIKAMKFAKPILDVKLFRKMNLANTCGFLTYGIGMALLALVAKYNKDNKYNS
jgi:hypothetical protein